MKLSILSLLSVVSYAVAEENPYSRFPKVPKTATINGFADRVLDDSPLCAKQCLSLKIEAGPCPYWDVGCFCVLSKHVKHFAKCIYDNCAGEDVYAASRVAVNKCSAVGVDAPYWMIDAADSSALESAAKKQVSPVSVSASASSNGPVSSSTSSAAVVPAAPASAAQAAAPLSPSLVPSASASSNYQVVAAALSLQSLKSAASSRASSESARWASVKTSLSVASGNSSSVSPSSVLANHSSSRSAVPKSSIKISENSAAVLTPALIAVCLAAAAFV